MPNKILYFDEAGFTGYNLLDPQQPIFCVASSDLGNDEASDLLADCFPRYQGNEFKFSNIWGSRSRDGLLKFGEHFKTLHERAFVYVVFKKFSVLTKIADFLIEPIITSAGYDFYSDGFCWKYCNYIHFSLTKMAHSALLDAIISAYQEFSRDPNEQSLARLQWRYAMMAESTEEPVKIFLEQMATGAELFDQFNNIETFRTSNEMQVSAMLASVSHWRQRQSDDFEVVHDNSSNFMRGKEMWERITNNNVPPQLHPMGDGTMVEFPLRVVSTTAVDSQTSHGVQFSDILAGLAVRHFSPLTTGDDRSFVNEVIQSGFGELTYNGVRPGTDFPDPMPPRALEGPDTVDKLTEIIFGSHNATSGKNTE